MITIRILFAFTLILPFQACLNAQGSDAITGIWLTPDDRAIVQIEKIDGGYAGKILRINPKLYINGSAPKDAENVDASLRTRSLEGITTLTDFTYNNKKESWQISKVYDPERGKYYEGFIVMQGPDRLKLRGHVPGKKWLGETQIWKRRDDFPQSN